MKAVMIGLALFLVMGCGENNKPEPLSKTKSPLSEKVQHTNQDSKAKVRTPIWEFEAGGRVLSSPAIGSDGTVYVGSYDKKLYAINGKSGVKLWEFETGDMVHSSLVIGSDSTVYVGSLDTKLYAIKTDSKGLAKSPWPMRGQNPQHTGRAPKKE